MTNTSKNLPCRARKLSWGLSSREGHRLTVIGARSSPQDSQGRKELTRLTVDPFMHTVTVSPAGNAGESGERGKGESSRERVRLESKEQETPYFAYRRAVLGTSASPSLPLARPLKTPPPFLFSSCSAPKAERTAPYCLSLSKVRYCNWPAALC